MNDNPREHFNLYYIFLYDKEQHPPPEGAKEKMLEALFGKRATT